jgi:hypothetical protein
MRAAIEKTSATTRETNMAVHKITDDDATPGVGLLEWGGEPLRRARMQRAAGGAMLIVAITGFVICMIATTFGLGPLALPVLLILIPLAMVGRWLRDRGALRLRAMRAEAARRDESLPAT